MLCTHGQKSFCRATLFCFIKLFSLFSFKLTIMPVLARRVLAQQIMPLVFDGGDLAFDDEPLLRVGPCRNRLFGRSRLLSGREVAIKPCLNIISKVKLPALRAGLPGREKTKHDCAP